MESDRDDLILNSFVAQRLKQHRERRDVTRENLARHLHLRVDVIERAESGVERLGALQLYEACQVLGVTLRSFFEGYDLFQQEVRTGYGQTAIQTAGQTIGQNMAQTAKRNEAGAS